MPFEIDYMPVGEGEKSGDAIVLRVGNLHGPRHEQKVVVIDGGFQSSAEQMVQHIKYYYGTDEIDLVISTHPDFDHVSGLHTILEEMRVSALLMHKPWEHAQNIRELFQNGRIRALGIGDRLEKSLQSASDLEVLADRKNVPIYEPFQGNTALGGALRFLGPSQDFYESLLPDFRGLPTVASSLASLITPAPVQKAAESVVRWIEDHGLLDLLDDDVDSTSAENNTSIITLLNIDGHKLLFTGDAGKTALLHAADYAEGLGIPLTGLRLFDVPHHGSKRNLNSKILKRIQGGAAIISVAKNSSKHPSKKVVNALQKHGMGVYTNCEGIVCFHGGTMPSRQGWANVAREPFHPLVEE